MLELLISGGSAVMRTMSIIDLKIVDKLFSAFTAGMHCFIIYSHVLISSSSSPSSSSSSSSYHHHRSLIITDHPLSTFNLFYHDNTSEDTVDATIIMHQEQSSLNMLHIPFPFRLLSYHQCNCSHHSASLFIASGSLHVVSPLKN